MGVDKLAESFFLQEVAKFVVLGGAHVDVSHYQGILLRVDELPQMLSQLGEGLSCRPVYANDVDFLHVKLDNLKVWLPKFGDYASHLLFDVGRKPFTMALTREMSTIALQLILLLFLFIFFEPGLCDEQDVALHQHRICPDVLHMLAK